MGEASEEVNEKPLASGVGSPRRTSPNVLDPTPAPVEIKEEVKPSATEITGNGVIWEEKSTAEEDEDEEVLWASTSKMIGCWPVPLLFLLGLPSKLLFRAPMEGISTSSIFRFCSYWLATTLLGEFVGLESELVPVESFLKLLGRLGLPESIFFFVFFQSRGFR